MSIPHPQAFVNAMNDVMKDVRADYHLTLGEAIELLEKEDPNLNVFFDYSDTLGPGQTHSYRGFYMDLAFEPSENVTVAMFLEECRKALDSTYTGYKGGEFTMGYRTPLWAASYGRTGPAILGLEGGLARFTYPIVVVQTKEIG